MANKKDEKKNRINREIRGVYEVRLVGDNVEVGVYPFNAALKMADEMGLDLIEISPNAEPPVCKIMDYQKYMYQQKKKLKEQQQKNAKVEVKELRFGPQTDDHDYEFKKNHAIEFLKSGNKVKASVFFKGRSIMFKEQGELILARLCEDLLEYGRPDKMPTMEGKRMLVMISPKTNKSK